VRALLALAFAITLAGCGGAKESSIAPVSNATRVSGTVTKVEDQRPVDGPVTLTVRTAGQKEEAIRIPSLFTGRPPTSEELALQAKVTDLTAGAFVIADGTRGSDGVLDVEKIEVR